jgi:hypothetical protein
MKIKNKLKQQKINMKCYNKIKIKNISFNKSAAKRKQFHRPSGGIGESKKKGSKSRVGTYHVSIAKRRWMGWKL